MSTTTPSASTAATPDFTGELAAAKLAALRSLLETLNATDDPVEKRRIAIAILRIPDPDAAARSKRAPRAVAPPDQPAATPVEEQSPRIRLENALHVLAHADDETFFKVACENAGRLPDLSPARFQRILAGNPTAAPARAPQACAAGP